MTGMGKSATVIACARQFGTAMQRKIVQDAHCCEVLSEVVETELAVGDVGHICGIGLTPLILVQVGLYQAHREAQETMHLAHPLAVTPCQVVVHCHHLRSTQFCPIQEQTPESGSSDDHV